MDWACYNRCHNVPIQKDLLGWKNHFVPNSSFLGRILFYPQKNLLFEMKETNPKGFTWDRVILIPSQTVGLNDIKWDRTTIFCNRNSILSKKFTI